MGQISIFLALLLVAFNNCTTQGFQLHRPSELGSATALSVDFPKGIYVLGATTPTYAPPVSWPNFVDGYAYRGMRWDDLEQSEGVYNFANISAAIQDCQANNKKLILYFKEGVLRIPSYLEVALGAENPSGLFSLNWVFGGVPIVTARPGNAYALERFNALMQALADYQVPDTASGGLVALKNHPTLAQIYAAIPGMAELRLRALTDLRTTYDSSYEEIGFQYSRSAFRQIVLDSVAITANAFPNKALFIGLFHFEDQTASPVLSEFISDELHTHFNGQKIHLGFFQENLTGVRPGINDGAALLRFKGQVPIIFEACWAWSGARPGHCTFGSTTETPEAGFLNGFNQFSSKQYFMYPQDLGLQAYNSIFESWSAVLRGEN